MHITIILPEFYVKRRKSSRDRVADLTRMPHLRGDFLPAANIRACRIIIAIKIITTVLYVKRQRRNLRKSSRDRVADLTRMPHLRGDFLPAANVRACR